MRRFIAALFLTAFLGVARASRVKAERRWHRALDAFADRELSEGACVIRTSGWGDASTVRHPRLARNGGRR